jgi:hypothetical protein
MNANEIAKLWEFLAQTWGNKFLEEYGAKPNDAWSMALAGIEPLAARFAVRQLINLGQPYAPTLPEFIAHAKRYRPLPTPATVLQLERKPADEAKARDNLKRLRDLLRS